MAKFNFNLRDADAKGHTGIYLIVRWNNNRLVYPTAEQINPKFWESDKSKRNFQRATKSFSEYAEFNARLDIIETVAKNVFRQFQNDNNNASPSIAEYRELLNKKFSKESGEVKKDLYSFIERFIEESKNKINDKTGKVFSLATINIYNNAFRLLKEYAQTKRKRIDFDTIDLDFYYDFSDYLTKTHGFAVNTIGKQMKTIKTFLNEATERGLNKNIAFKSKRFKVIKEETDSIYLSESELKEISELNLTDNLKLDKVRDLFLVGCWTGLRFSDFSEIRPQDIKSDFIEVRTKKTGESVVIPIHETIKGIIKKYYGKTDNSLPPTISNANMNEYLKELGFLVDGLHVKISTSITKGGLNITTTNKKYELITTHTARRSFATNLYLDGVPSYTIMRITGHRTEKAFLRYIKITPNESAKVLQLHWKRKTENSEIMS